MNLPRRQFLHLAAGAAVLPALSCIASAQPYPSRPVRIVVGYSPGGGTDIIARLIGQRLWERLGQQFIVDNRPGAASNIATEVVVRAPPDGYTLLVVDSSPAISAAFYEKLSFNFIRDIAPVACIIRAPLVMLVNPSVPVKTIPDFIRYAKANPRSINMASAGNGSTAHVSGELFKMLAGVDMVHVPYRGTGPALTDTLGGQVQVYFTSISASIDYITTGQLRALAVTTATRSDALPEVPTICEFVPGYEASVFYGVCAPKRTPIEIIEKVNVEINAALVDPKFKAQLLNVGSVVLPGSPADFGKLIAEETEKWAKVVKFTGVKAD